jgi:hypothetical protein
MSHALCVPMCSLCLCGKFLPRSHGVHKDHGDIALPYATSFLSDCEYEITF